MLLVNIFEWRVMWWEIENIFFLKSFYFYFLCSLLLFLHDIDTNIDIDIDVDVSVIILFSIDYFPSCISISIFHFPFSFFLFFFSFYNFLFSLLKELSMNMLWARLEDFTVAVETGRRTNGYTGKEIRKCQRRCYPNINRKNMRKK